MDSRNIDTSVLPPLPADLAEVQPSASATAPRVETQTVVAVHNAVKAEELSVFIGARCLLANAELKIAEQAHAVQANTPGAGAKSQQRGTCYGLVGVNGCGKSTLLRLIGDRSLPVPPTWDIFIVNQHLPTPVAHGAIEEVLTADVKRAQLLSEQAALYEQIATLSEGDAQLLLEAHTRLHELHNELCKWDGAEQNITQILLALGFRASAQTGVQSGEPTLQTPMNRLSGGWRMKVQLAKALWLQPKLLLLDEPTNHLDFQALRWLEEKLEHYPHTSVVVSHDVSFLHGVCREILWMKDLKLEALPRDMVSQEDLLRMQRRRALNFHFATPEGNDAQNHGLSLHGVEFCHESASSCSSHGKPHRLQVKKEMRFSGSSRSVLLGKNGSGKSTFLDLCVGKLRPTRGNIDRTPDLKIGHYSQLTEELDANSTDTAASFLVRECGEELAAHAGCTRTARLQSVLAASTDKPCNMHAAVSAKAATQQKKLLEIARGVLSRFGFEGDVASSVPVDRLSGGQKALLKFAVLSIRPAHILLLDEPTNHLDAEACEALAKGLSEFKGGIVAVTHDELLIYRLIHCNWSASELLVCRGGTVWRERNFGAHCLNALKNEVHRAEEPEVQVSKGRQSSPGQQPPNATTIVTTKEVPPWLQGRRRTREKKDQVSTSAILPVHSDNISEVYSAAPLPCEAHTPMQPPIAKSNGCGTLPTSTSEALHEENRNAPDSWEDGAESDASTAAPEGVEEAEVMQVMPAPANLGEVVGNHAASLSLDGAIGCTEGQGRHSRFRKDMVNLNKALTKWLRQEGKGELTIHQVLERIRSSKVALQLRALHGHEFSEERFVEEALEHARRSCK